MGNTYWILPEVASDKDDCNDLTTLYREVGKLDEICREIGVTKLSEFVDSSEIAQDFDLDVPVVVSDPFGELDHAIEKASSYQYVVK